MRTCLGSSRWNSTIASLTWKASATPAGRLLFRLVPSTRDTEEIAYGLWRTPNAAQADRGAQNGQERLAQGHSMSLQDQVKTWPTPRAEDKKDLLGELATINEKGRGIRPSGKDCSVALSAKVKYFTPDANCHKGGDRRGQINQQVPGSLSPAWVEWLMGFPRGWTETTAVGRTTRTRKLRARPPGSRTERPG